MTDINHRRKNRAPVNKRHAHWDYHNGYGRTDTPKNESAQRTGRTDFLDKSMHGWARKSTLSDRSLGARIGNDFTNGHRGMAKAVKGAKKFVRTRVRFHENIATKKLGKEVEI